MEIVCPKSYRNSNDEEEEIDAHPPSLARLSLFRSRPSDVDHISTTPVHGLPVVVHIFMQIHVAVFGPVICCCCCINRRRRLATIFS